MELSDELLTEISYVQISKYRTKVMMSLDSDVKIPSGIAKDSGIRTNHISKILKELREHGLVECINPEVRKGRLYRLTDKGEELVKNLDYMIESSEAEQDIIDDETIYNSTDKYNTEN